MQAVTTFMDFLGLKKICLRTDGEPASGALSASNQDCSKRRDTAGNDAAILEFFRWVLLNAAIEVLKVRSDA